MEAKSLLIFSMTVTYSSSFYEPLNLISYTKNKPVVTWSVSPWLRWAKAKRQNATPTAKCARSIEDLPSLGNPERQNQQRVGRSWLTISIPVQWLSASVEQLYPLQCHEISNWRIERNSLQHCGIKNRKGMETSLIENLFKTTIASKNSSQFINTMPPNQLF